MSFENWKRLLQEVEEMRQQDKDKKKANKGKARSAEKDSKHDKK